MSYMSKYLSLLGPKSGAPKKAKTGNPIRWDAPY
jgi:hypothetical protein